MDIWLCLNRMHGCCSWIHWRVWGREGGSGIIGNRTDDWVGSVEIEFVPRAGLLN